MCQYATATCGPEGIVQIILPNRNVIWGYLFNLEVRGSAIQYLAYVHRPHINLKTYKYNCCSMFDFCNTMRIMPGRFRMDFVTGRMPHGLDNSFKSLGRLSKEQLQLEAELADAERKHLSSSVKQLNKKILDCKNSISGVVAYIIRYL